MLLQLLNYKYRTVSEIQKQKLKLIRCLRQASKKTASEKTTAATAGDLDPFFFKTMFWFIKLSFHSCIRGLWWRFSLPIYWTKYWNKTSWEERFTFVVFFEFKNRPLFVKPSFWIILFCLIRRQSLPTLSSHTKFVMFSPQIPLTNGYIQIKQK